MGAMSVWAKKKGLASKKPQTPKMTALRRKTKMPVLAARSAWSWSFSPKERERRAFMPTPVPPPTAIIRFCRGKARETAFRASWLILATKMLSTML